MNTYSNPYHYRGTDFYIQSTYNQYWVRISYQPSTTINQTAFSSRQEYETPHYPSQNQAIMHGEGWVDRMLNRDFSQSKLLDQRYRFENMGRSEVTTEQLIGAYWKGWEIKDKELNNI
jgi:hypothetical protein